MAFVQSRTATTQFRYEELPNYANTPVPRDFKSRDMQSMYTARVAAATEGLKNVVGSNRVPEWHSPAPRNESAADIHLDSWRLLHRMGAMGSVGRLWLGCMFPFPRMIVKNIACFGDQWFWVLSDSGAVGAFGWSVENELYHTLAPKSSAQAGILLHIYDLNQWIVCEIEGANSLRPGGAHTAWPACAAGVAAGAIVAAARAQWLP